eukprot:2385516-Amphidinium_carterae.1
MPGEIRCIGWVTFVNLTAVAMDHNWLCWLQKVSKASYPFCSSTSRTVIVPCKLIPSIFGGMLVHVFTFCKVSTLFPVRSFLTHEGLSCAASA